MKATASSAGAAGACDRRLSAALLTTALAMATHAAQADPLALDEHGLAGITAQSAAGRSTGSSASSGHDTASRPPRPPDSRIVIEARHAGSDSSVVRLDDGAQSEARGLNLVNAATADVGQGANVLDLRAGGVHARDVGQSNRISQTAAREARLGRFVARGSDLERTSRSSSTARESASRRHRIEDADRHLRSTMTTTRIDAEVDAVRVGVFDDPVTFEAPAVDLPGFSFQFPTLDVSFVRTEGGPIVTWWTDRFAFLPEIGGIVERTISARPISVSAGSAELTFGQIRLEGSDVILEGPKLHMPALEFDICFHNIGCGDGFLDGDLTEITIPARTFSLGDELRLSDANPIGDLGYDLGYAVAGDGTITVEPGSLSFAGSIPLDPEQVFRRSFGALSADVYGQIEQTLTANLDLPQFDLDVDVDIALPIPDGFNREIGSETCVFSETQRGCTPLDVTTTERDEREQGRSETQRSETSRSESHFLVEGSRERGRVELRAGEGDLLVFRSASAEERRYVVIVIEGGAQSGMRALNAVNAAGAVIGNGLNVIAAPAGVARPSTGPGSRLSQSNTFKQIGGLRYRGDRRHCRGMHHETVEENENNDTGSAGAGRPVVDGDRRRAGAIRAE